MKDSMGKAIIIGAIGSALGGIALLFFTKDLFSKIWSFISGIFVWILSSLNDSYSLVGWLWIPLILLALIGLINLIHAFRPNSEKSLPAYYQYKEDFIHMAKWRWKWKDNRISNLWCFCPACDATLVYNDPSVRDFLSNEKGTKFICENCDRVVAKIDSGDKDYAISAVTREIDRRIRTGQYQAPNK